MSSVKRIRLELPLNGEDTLLNAAEVISFYFDNSSEVKPEFVHQNFGQSGEINWPTDLLPLKISLNVFTSKGLQTAVKIEHGGDFDSERAQRKREEIISRLEKPCDLEGGCRPAVYPGSIKHLDGSTEEDALSPSQTTMLEDGHVVVKYSSKDFPSRSLTVWKRAEWLMLWFIESVSQSQHETDPHWDYFFLKDGEGRILSLCSLYIFPSFAFLSKGFIGDRVRLSQFLTIPSNWKNGNGSKLLRHIVENIKARDDVDKFTMEDPSFGMTSLRESVYLRIAKEEGYLKSRGIPIRDLETSLKIPLCFSKRIKNLIEICHLKGNRAVDSNLVDRILASDNKYVQKFIDSIEFYDDDEVDEEALDKPVTEDETRLLVRERLLEALSKLEKIKF